jgi:hypothetical protein
MRTENIGFETRTIWDFKEQCYKTLSNPES